MGAIVELTQEELDFVGQQTTARLAIKKHNKRISNYNDHQIVFMGIAGEFCAAKYLSCHFDPFPHRGGDSHRRDLWRGQLTTSVKTRHHYLPADFLFAPHQIPTGGYPDDYGVVGRWRINYWSLELIGYFTRRDFEQHSGILTFSRDRNRTLEERVGLAERFLRPIEELKTILEQEPDETILPESDSGWVRSLWNGTSRGGG